MSTFSQSSSLSSNHAIDHLVQPAQSPRVSVNGSDATPPPPIAKDPSTTVPRDQATIQQEILSEKTENGEASGNPSKDYIIALARLPFPQRIQHKDYFAKSGSLLARWKELCGTEVAAIHARLRGVKSNVAGTKAPKADEGQRDALKRKCERCGKNLHPRTRLNYCPGCRGVDADNIEDSDSPATPSRQIRGFTPKTTTHPQSKADKHPIKCAMSVCSKGAFTETYLREHQINIKETREARIKDGFWVCPGCLEKIAKQQSSQDAVTTPLSKLSTKFGRERLGDEQIIDALECLSSLTFQYAARACNPDGPLHARTPFLELFTIRYEIDLKERDRDVWFLQILRRMLKIEEGISIRQKVQRMQICPERSLWISGLLAYVIAEAIFTTESAFDDTWHILDGLSYSGFTKTVSAQILQDFRRRQISNLSKSSKLAVRLKHQHDALMHRLNETMDPIVPCSPDTEIEHSRIASQVEELKLKILAYKGDYKAIWPKLGDPFDVKDHILEDSTIDLEESHSKSPSVLLTTMVGVKVKSPDGRWRLCCRARVRLLHGCLPTKAAGGREELVPQATSAQPMPTNVSHGQEMPAISDHPQDRTDYSDAILTGDKPHARDSAEHVCSDNPRLRARSPSDALQPRKRPRQD